MFMKLAEDITKAETKLKGFLSTGDSLKREETLKHSIQTEKRNYKGICEQRIKAA